jgi:tetratricopeptide (TPR) repeat protein
LRIVPRILFLGCFLYFCAAAFASQNIALILAGTGGIERSQNGTDWTAFTMGSELAVGDRLRTRELSRATLKFNDVTELRIGASSEVRLLNAQGGPRLEFISGTFYFLSRDPPGSWIFETPSLVGTNRGTEFGLQVEARTGATVVDVMEGAVDLAAQGAVLRLHRDEQGRNRPGQAPQGPFRVETVKVVQWWLFYPAVIDVSDLKFDEIQGQEIKKSVNAYAAGNLPAALSNWPKERMARSDKERIYLAALALSAGQVEFARLRMKECNPTNSLLSALERLISAVSAGTNAETFAAPSTASEWLGQSYWEQAQIFRPNAIDRAHDAADRATKLSPRFGFAWARLAELDFSLGRLRAAGTNLQEALKWSPENPQAQTLEGFILAAENKLAAAAGKFQRAIELDGSLGNAWLGKGLVLIRQGKSKEGLAALVTAAAQEPNRSLLRSYFAKALANSGDWRKATNEITEAIILDPSDPTPWLYSALLAYDNLRINKAVAELEHSIDLNDNRALYRSQFLLDQDRSIRSVNLSSVYKEAGMFEQSVNEATRSVASDYGNYSAHLFLANSYSELTDPNLINLRYETATVSEYLIANLLSPASAGPLSPTISQQEYSRLFDRGGFGFTSSGTYLSEGSWQQQSAQFGIFDTTSYSLETVSRFFHGTRANEDLRQTIGSAQAKQQIGRNDTLYIQAVFDELDSGDVRQYYDTSTVSAGLRAKERQRPNLFLGLRHEWSPTAKSLLLVSHMDDHFQNNDSLVALPEATTDFNNIIRGPADSRPFNLSYRSAVEAYSGELQQIWQTDNNVFVAGGKVLSGEASVVSRLDSLDNFPPFDNFADPAVNQRARSAFHRISVYAYDNWRISRRFLLSAGLSYDRLDIPENISGPPVSNDTSRRSQASPKAGFVWTPLRNFEIRAAYTKSLGGLFYDQSIRLEPTQVAGLNQAFRSLFPESVVGPVPGAQFQTYQAGINWRAAHQTYFDLQASILEANADRAIGLFYINFPPASAAQTIQRLNSREESVAFTVNQLIGEEVSIGARWRSARTDLQWLYPELPTSITEPVDSPLADQRLASILHQLDLFAIYNHRLGFFAKAEGIWWGQTNQRDASRLVGDNFWQANAYVGYRFPRRRAEVTIGVANLMNQDYHVYPLTMYDELPHRRTLVATLKLSF